MTKFPFKIAFRVAVVCTLFKLLLATTALLTLSTPAPICTWDCTYYRGISETGYAQFQAGQQTNLAFFPAFPLLIKAFRSVIPGPFESVAIGLNLALFFVFILLFCRWSFEVGFKKDFWLPPLLLSLDRFSLWSQVPYTEALFLVLTLGSLLLLRTSRSRSSEALAALMGGLASGTRLVGVSLVAGLGIARLRGYLRKPWWGAVILALGISGMTTFFLYLQFSQGAWNLSLRTTEAWHRQFSVLGLGASLFYLVKFFYFPTILIFALSLWMLIKPLPGLNLTKEERWTFAFLIFIPMASSIQVSLPRYLCVILPGYLGWAYLVKKYPHPAWKLLWMLVFVFEVYWQYRLTQKFYLGEVFKWAA